jgi:nucleoside phosphorylase
MGLEPKPIDAAEHCQIANYPPPLSYRDYTVGWICALPVEMAAAEGMLDEHYPPSPTPHDGEDGQTPYTLGRIGPHYVVLACLPSGILGKAAASKVADQMQSSFKGIRFGVLVGIGGGVPSKDNGVRLGDVVVSKPTDTFGGVIQYDFGKTIQEGRFKQTGSLNKPPVELLRAVSTLQARHIMEDHKLSKYMAEMRSSYPKMASQFTFPGTQHDSLYEAGYDHTGDATTCSECDAAKLVHRQPRTSDDPVIHYGLIASGDQVMRHGITRDQLSREHAVLCFEMEAAGLMDTFPCLVIRGICDYADSHKNKLWQGYAAAVAAAYAKELLLLIPGKQVAVTQTSAGVISPSSK